MNCLRPYRNEKAPCERQHHLRGTDHRGIALLIVLHTRKETAEDVFNTISGTNGLLGAADGALVLHKSDRTSADAVLEVTGRDQPQMRLHLRFDPVHLWWMLTEAETELYRKPPNPLFETLSRLVTEENPSWKGTATELAQCLSVIDNCHSFSPNWIVRTLNAQQEILLQDHSIHYRTRRTQSGKIIELYWEGIRSCTV